MLRISLSLDGSQLLITPCLSMKKGIAITGLFRWPVFVRLLLIFYALISSSEASSPNHPSEQRRTLTSTDKTVDNSILTEFEERHRRSLFEITDLNFWPLNDNKPLHKNLNTDDIFSQDADADDDLFGHSNDIDDDTDASAITIENDNTTESLSNRNCTWYTLSHYIPPDTILYDSIEGVLIALLFCLVMATCYNLTYYCCFVRCGCCPDDRVYLSKLNRKGRKARRLARPNKRISRGRRTGGCFGSCWNWLCCCCCWNKDRDGTDGKGAFMLISNETDSVSACSFDDGMGGDDDHSSLSLDSALSLEYGDDHLHNEYGEVTSRWDDAKIEEAAKAYFEVEEKASEERMMMNAASSVKSKSGSRKKSDRSVRSKKSNRSRKSGRSGKSRGGRSRRSARSRHSSVHMGDAESTVFSQSSSILTSDSENSYSTGSSDDDDEIEMEDAMMDLDVEHRRVRMEALQMLQRAERTGGNSGSR